MEGERLQETLWFRTMDVNAAETMQEDFSLFYAILSRAWKNWIMSLQVFFF